jgi:hypothetical protein
MTDWSLRLRSLLDRWFAVAVVALVTCAVVGGWLTYGAYAAPGTHQEQRTVEEWAVEGSFAHGARVTDAASGTAFEPGTVVRNRSVYFQRAMPVLDGRFALDYEGTEEPAEVRIERRLVITSIGTGGTDGRSVVYWQHNRSLGTNRTTVRPDGRVTAPFEVDVGRTLAEARNASRRLGSPGELGVRVEMAVEVVRRVDGASPRRLTFTLPVETGSGTYRVSDGRTRKTFSRTRAVTVRDDPSPSRAYGGPAMLAFGVLGTVVLGGIYRRGVLCLSPDERDWLTYREDRADFDDWITTVGLPEGADQLPVAEAATLGDLVNLAIDTNSAVLDPPDDDAYHVVHDGYRYTFERPVPFEASPTAADRTSEEPSVGRSVEDPATADGDSPDVEERSPGAAAPGPPSDDR